MSLPLMALRCADGPREPASRADGVVTADVVSACEGAPYRASDYLLGSWVATVKVPGADGRLEVDPTVDARMEVERMPGGCGLLERRVVERDGRDPVHIVTVRAYDANEEAWRQLLVSTTPAVLQFRGEPDGDGLAFVATRPGGETLVRVAERPLGESAFDRAIEASDDGGESWVLEDVVEYRRPETP